MVSTATLSSTPAHASLPHLTFNLHDSLLRQSARLNYGDSFSGEVSKHFLMKTEVGSQTFRTLT